MYILPGAGPVAANISLREAGIPFDMVKVNRRTKRTDDGLDFNEVDSKGGDPFHAQGYGSNQTGQCLANRGAVIHDEHNGIRRLHRKRPRWSPA
jgi:hypothetical protein